MSRRRGSGCGLAVAAVVVLLVFVATGCGGSKPKPNVVPPQPGVPAQRSDVQGIYRTLRQSLLQLRGDGEFVLIMREPPGPSAGEYTLEGGKVSVTTNVCGSAVGEYTLVVGGEPVPGKATLTFTLVKDDCASRSQALTGQSWVYADS